MSTLNIKNPFVMTVDDGDTKRELKANFRDFTKAERTEFEKKHKAISETVEKSQALLKKMKRVSKSAELKEKQDDFKGQEKELKELYKLEDELERITADFNEQDEQKNLLKDRFEICLDGEDAAEVFELAEVHGYDKVYAVIQESVAEYSAGK